MTIDLILTNGNIYTLDSTRPRAKAMAFAYGRVVAFDDDALALRTKQTQVIDLQGRTVIPGLIDHHIHFTAWAASLKRVNLEGALSLEQAVERVEARAKTTKPGEWIIGLGWNQLDWTTPTFPTKAPLDAVAPNNPIVLDRKDGHSIWVNSSALRAANITRDTPNPDGGVIDRDATGEPTGILRDNAMDLLEGKRGFDAEALSEDDLLHAIQQAHKLGLTGIHNVEGADSLRLFQRLRAQDKLTLRVTHMIPASNLEHAMALGVCGGLGDEWLRIGGIKMFADGSLGSQTAWMLQSFEGQPGNCGIATTPIQEVERPARMAASAGMMVCTHAIGDRANREVLNVYEKLRREGFTTPLRIEHAQHLDREDVPRFAALSVIASMQPIHCTSDYNMTDALLGQRGRFTYAFKSLLDSGASLAFGSDCPVETLDPWVGIHAAVTRERANGEPRGGWHPEEKLSVAEAASAYGSRLSVGEVGDCVVLSQNIFEVAPKELLNTRVDYTIVGGQVVYSSMAEN
ncbi:MAG: amidohydrolase [Chloroflexi bacterium]|nr:amidohydrolase [Chloroflexota bacterium]